MILHTGQAVEVRILRPDHSSDGLRRRVDDTVDQRQLVLDSCFGRGQGRHASTAPSHALALALAPDRGIDSTEEAPHPLERLDGDEFYPVLVGQRPNLLPGSEP